jgi:hypothetical protein
VSEVTVRRYFVDGTIIGHRGYIAGMPTYTSMPDALLAAYVHLMRVAHLRPGLTGDVDHSFDGRGVVVFLRGLPRAHHLRLLRDDPLIQLSVSVGIVDLPGVDS